MQLNLMTGNKYFCLLERSKQNSVTIFELTF